MKNIPGLAVLVLLGAFVLAPVLVAAQTAATSTDTAGTTPAQWQMMRGWRQQGEFQQQIAALGSIPVQSLPMPVLFGVTLANISPNFGDPRDGGARTHEGEDIMAVKGTPIVSPTDAVVIRTGVGTSEGNYVTTANPGGETFVYMHLDRFGEGVVAGAVLMRGSLIGYVGNTGNASGGAAHLHFEVHNSSGTPTDPFARLTSEFSPMQKILFLTTILAKTIDPVALSQFLVTNFRTTFTSDLQSGIVLPPLITGALGSVSVATGGTSALTRNLYFSISGQDVLALQKLLNAHGYTVAASGPGSYGNETMYFGPATRTAVIKFQLARSIVPAVGYVGPLTRAALATI